MNIFFVASEVAPIVKVGGLGDVVGALPKYLKNLGHDVRVICPLYGHIKNREGWIPYEMPLEVWCGHEKRLCKIWEGRLPGSDVKIYFIEYNLFYARDGVYDSPWGSFQDNDHRFVFLTRAAINICNYLKWYPDVFHCHDWMTGLLPLYLNTHDKGTRVAEAATVMTIHNLQFQGQFYPGLTEWAHLNRKEVLTENNLLHKGGVNMLKGGIYNATKVNAVSPGYAEEIKTPVFGYGLDPVLRFKAADLTGILNGIDNSVWNPSLDCLLPARYSAADLSGKAACKAELQKTFGLEVNPDIPLFGVVSRLSQQKGLDLLNAIVPRLMENMKIQIVVTGTGEQALQWGFATHASRYAGRVGAFAGFCENKAHLTYAGSDAFLIPSRFEPCGLTQQYAMKYGTLPVARATGGLADTIEQYCSAAGGIAQNAPLLGDKISDIPAPAARGTGFLFNDATADALYNTIGWACSTWYDKKDEWKTLQQNGMAKEFGWEKRALEYEKLYACAVEARTGKKVELPDRTPKQAEVATAPTAAPGEELTA
jgi:starch synthase